MRVDDWDEDSWEEHAEGGAAVPVPIAPARDASTTLDAPDTPLPDEAEAVPTARPRPPLAAVLPIYIIGIVSISTICLMFTIVMVLIFTR